MGFNQCPRVQPTVSRLWVYQRPFNSWGYSVGHRLLYLSSPGCTPVKLKGPAKTDGPQEPLGPEVRSEAHLGGSSGHLLGVGSEPPLPTGGVHVVRLWAQLSCCLGRRPHPHCCSPRPLPTRTRCAWDLPWGSRLSQAPTLRHTVPIFPF